MTSLPGATGATGLPGAYGATGASGAFGATGASGAFGALGAPEPPAAPGGGTRNRAEIDTTLARMTGLFGLLFALLSIPVLSASAGTLRPEAAWLVPIALFGSIVAAAVCSLLGRGVRVGMAVLPIVFLIALLLWPLAVRSPEAAIGTQPWLWYIVIVASTSAAISFPTGWAAIYAVGVPVVYAVLRVLPAGGGASWVLASLDAVYALVLGVFVVIVITTLRSAASRVDAVQGAAVASYAEAATRHAAEQERTRVDTVIHDRVLSTLLAAARSRTADDRSRVVQMAGRALVALQSAEAESDGTAEVELDLLVQRSRALATTLTAEIGFAVEGDFSGRVPARVVEGVYSAVVQAVVNSVQHAGDGIPRSLTLHGWGPAGFSVRIADEGVGFAVDEVPADRLGVRISIRERVDSVGGVAHVQSAPGEGTVVVIEWPAGPGERGFA